MKNVADAGNMKERQVICKIWYGWKRWYGVDIWDG